jgi:type IV pilus assembly protein PilA
MTNASPAARAFTLIELMVVLAIVAILAAIALPSVQGRVIRAQVAQGRALAGFVQQAVQAAYAASAAMPADNAAAAVPPADHIVNNVVASVAVQAGAVVVTFGNQASRALAGHRLALRPAVVDGYPQVPITWICAGAGVPANMSVHAADATDLPPALLPIDCRAPAPHP